MKSNFDEPGTGYVQGLTIKSIADERTRNIHKGLLWGFAAGVVVTFIVMKFKK